MGCLHYFLMFVCNVYFAGKKRLDLGIGAVMKYLRVRTHRLFVSKKRGKLSWRTSKIRQNHKASLKMKRLIFEIKGGEEWQLSLGPNSKRCCTIKKANQKPHACSLKCDICGICVHEFTCSCPANSKRFEMCKHIHYVKAHVGK